MLGRAGESALILGVSGVHAQPLLVNRLAECEKTIKTPAALRYRSVVVLVPRKTYGCCSSRSDIFCFLLFSLNFIKFHRFPEPWPR